MARIRGIFRKIKLIHVLATFQVNMLFGYCNDKKWKNFQIITFPLNANYMSRQDMIAKKRQLLAV